MRIQGVGRHRRPCGSTRTALSLEPLEQRALLSATAQFQHVIFNPTTHAALSAAALMGATPAELAPLGSSSPGSAKTPDQIRTAYGISGISGDGTGQTIAIIDAYRNPNIAGDLAQFDSYFGLPAPPSFSILNQYGGSNVSGITADGGWAGEIALDVEWAHAIAPGAGLILIEANSASNSDLWTAVDTARNIAGVTAISMSFGSPESGSDTSDNAHFTTPSGHAGITFFAATGDSGSPGCFPAYSPNVVAVGGTSLSLSGGTYLGETAWASSGGGQSAFQAKSSYQSSVNASNFRQTPDVAFDADPNTGVAVYDSYNGGSTPWYQFGGTSLAAPCWAGLIAIADQMRASQGLGSLDGPSQTLPKLYALPSADFHDITSGSNGGFSAKSGYDEVTGRGTPVANLLVPGLAIPPTPDLTITKSHTGNFHPGDVGETYTIVVTNSGGAATAGTVSVVDALPAGLTATGMSGSGWSINFATLTATRSDSLAGGASYPAITVTVNVPVGAPSSVTNTATVSGGGETYTANDTASDPTTIGLLTIVGTSPSLSSGSMTAGATTLAINFSSAASGAGTASNYQLQSAGADRLLGTGDDVVYTLGASYSSGTATLTFPALTENVYRLTVKDAITDTVGGKLDGNGDGAVGGNLVADFVVLPANGGLLTDATVYSSAGTNPLSVATGDFNGDGNADFAAVNMSGTVGIFLGDGKGDFNSGTTLSGLSTPYDVAVGDFNNDGKLDLAVANFGINAVQIFNGNGSGGFSAGASINVGTQPLSLAVADFNGDGRKDIAVADYGSNDVGILINNGSGGFTFGAVASGGVKPRAVAFGDFNRDGKPDLAVTNNDSGNVVILLGNGSGGFTAQSPVSTGGAAPKSIAVGDFNGDGKLDLAIGNHDDSTVAILLGNGSGGLGTASLVDSAA